MRCQFFRTGHVGPCAAARQAPGRATNLHAAIHFFVNGSQRSKAYERAGNFIFEDSQQPNGDMIEQWFPNDAGGQLFKVEDWFEFDNNGFDIRAYDDGDLARRLFRRRASGLNR